jgi:hypothetical protein
MSSKASRIVDAGSFVKGGKPSSVSRIASIKAGKWAAGSVELSVLAPFFKGRQNLIGKPARKSQRREIGSKASRIVRAGSLFQGRQHLIGKPACKSQHWQMGSKARRIAHGGSLFQRRQHLIVKPARKSRREEMSSKASRIVDAGSLFQWRQNLIRNFSQDSTPANGQEGQ